MTVDLPAQAVALAQDHFVENLTLAFVGGSYARGTQTTTSDIDIFVLLQRGDRPIERAFAEDLRDLHRLRQLSFDHCGEIFDVATLRTLLAFTEKALAAAPALYDSACYQADCPLSIFRKGDVVFKFLADPKIRVTDPHTLLPKLEQAADAYFARWPMPRVQHHKDRLSLPPRSAQSALAADWARSATGTNWIDTPVGIGLERWFGAHLLPLVHSATRRSVRTPPTVPWACPLPFTDSTTRDVFASQCLAFSHCYQEGP